MAGIRGRLTRLENAMGDSIPKVRIEAGTEITRAAVASLSDGELLALDGIVSRLSPRRIIGDATMNVEEYAAELRFMIPTAR